MTKLPFLLSLDFGVKSVYDIFNEIHVHLPSQTSLQAWLHLNSSLLWCLL